MNAVGIIAEYNPFHNGHLYHLNEAKKISNGAPIILIMSTCFTQRGDSSLLTKREKTMIALEHGIDLVIELPFPFSVQSADIFAYGSISLLKNLGVSHLVFGSETNDIDLLKILADTQLNNKEYEKLVKIYIDKGINYPTALSKALFDIKGITIDKPNDILGLSYIREIIKQEANIEAISIKRTNEYHSTTLDNNISSASSIRSSLKNNIDIKNFVPKSTYKYLNKEVHFIDEYFSFLKYKIMSEKNNLGIYQTVDEGIENRINIYINKSSSLDELINNIKTKRYTYNKLSRMFTHILCNFTKEEAKLYSNITYIRVLGFSKNGRKYLNKIKKQTQIPIITNYSKTKDPMLELEYRVNSIYASIFNEDIKNKLVEEEYKAFPIKS